MQAEARIDWFDQEGQLAQLRTKLSALQACEIAASKYGFYDVDLVDNDPQHYKIVAKSHNRKLTSKGCTLEQAVEKLLGMFIDE